MPGRRKTLLLSAKLSELWDALGADICHSFSTERQDRTSYVVNSHVNFEVIADRINTILGRLLQRLEESFPGIFTTHPINITYRHREARGGSQTRRGTRSGSPKRSRRGTRSAARTVSQPRWMCMNYWRTVDEWTHKPSPFAANSEMKRLQQTLRRCMEESTEKFVVMPLRGDSRRRRGRLRITTRVSSSTWLRSATVRPTCT